MNGERGTRNRAAPHWWFSAHFRVPRSDFEAPPPTALTDLPVLGTLPGLALEFDGGLSIVHELLDLVPT